MLHGAPRRRACSGLRLAQPQLAGQGHGAPQHVLAQPFRGPARALDAGHLTDIERLTSAEAGVLASHVAVINDVRLAMRQYQRDFAHQPGGAVIDGRDIGTVVCPDADVKLFIVADSKARMERRARQLEKKGERVDRYALYHQIEERDARDMANPHGGFYRAPDAHLLDTTLLDIEAALRAAVAIVDGVMARKA